MKKYYLDPIMYEGVVVEEYNEYKVFSYSRNFNKDMSSSSMEYLIRKIKQLCGATYWNCVHTYITGFDKITGEQYCINNHTLDIPFKNVSIIDVHNAFCIIFDTLLEEPTENTPYTNFDYWNAIIIQYFKIVMKQTKPEKKSKRKALSGKTRLDVMERDDYKCQMCGRTVEDGVKLHIDHIVPVSKGGGNDIDNLQVLCHECNLAKHDRMDLKATREKIGERYGENKEKYIY